MITTNLAFSRNCPRDDAEAGTISRQSVTWLSQDGLNWEVTCPPEGINTIWYDATWHRGMGYNLAYYGKDFAGTLWRTRDGRNWRPLATEVFPEAHRHGYEEAALAFHPQTHQACALVRVNKRCAMIGTAPAPYYQDWTWEYANVDVGDGQIKPAADELGVQLGGPYLMHLSDGRLLAAGRADASSDGVNRGRIDLFWMDPEKALLTRFAKLEGCAHYPGIVEHEGQLWISCAPWEQGQGYDVYLAKVDIPPRDA